MNVDFYTFSKRINSTAQPTGGASYSCVIKSPSSVISPKISIVWGGSGNPSAYNYAYISDYGRYYWVSNWTYADRQWSADLSVDVLATYKTEIGSATKYVLRAASQYNSSVVDTMWPARTSLKTSGTTAASLGWANYGSGGGTFVVAVIGEGNASASSSAVALYMMSGTSVQALINNQLNAIDGAFNNMTATDVKEAVMNLLTLPFRFTSDLSQYIKSIMWFPFTFPAGGGGPVYLGMFQCLTAASNVSSPMITQSATFDISGYPAVGSDAWEYMAPFASYAFELEPFGIIPLDSMDIVSGSSLQASVAIDAMSGLGMLRLFIDGRTIAMRSAQIGVSVPFGGTAPNYAGAITGAVSVAATAAAYYSGDASGGALAGAIGSAVSASSPTGYSSGTAGGGAALEGLCRFIYRVLEHTDVDVTEAGRPLCLDVAINTLSGFVQCRDGDVSAPGTASELAQIESFLTGGFFYE